MGETEVQPRAPRWLVGFSVVLLLVMVGGAIGAGQLVLAGERRADRSGALAPHGPAPVGNRSPGQGSPGDAASACPGGCAHPGTLCVEGTCRLAPGAHWRLSPERVLVVGGEPRAMVIACVHPQGQERTCFTAHPVGQEGAFFAYGPLLAPSITVRTEDLEPGGMEIEVDGVRARAPIQRFKATPLLFEKGPILRLAPDGTGIGFRIERVP